MGAIVFAGLLPIRWGDSFRPRVISSMCGSVRDQTQGLICETLPTAPPGIAIYSSRAFQKSPEKTGCGKAPSPCEELIFGPLEPFCSP